MKSWVFSGFGMQDGDGAVTAEDLMRWHGAELSLKADRAKPVETFAEMINEVGWEMDDEEHSGPRRVSPLSVPRCVSFRISRLKSDSSHVFSAVS